MVSGAACVMFGEWLGFLNFLDEFNVEMVFYVLSRWGDHLNTLYGSYRLISVIKYKVVQKSKTSLKEVMDYIIWNILDETYPSPKYHSFWVIIIFIFIFKKKSKFLHLHTNNFQMKYNVA